MANRITHTPVFENRCKRFLKKFPSLKNELAILETDLLKNPVLGEPLGADLYKIRLASKDKVKGKSGGFRIITYLLKEIDVSCEIYLIIIYDKSEESTINKSMLLKLIKSIFS